MTSLIHWLYPGDGATCLVVNLVVQIAAAVLVAALVSGTLLRRWPAAQHAVWLACLGFALVCPLTALSSARNGIFLLSPLPLGEGQGVRVVSVAPARQLATGNASEAARPTENEPRELPDQPRQRESAFEPHGEPAAVPPVVKTEPAAQTKLEKTSTAAAQAKPFDLRALVAAAIGIWAAGVLFLAARLLHGILAVHTLRRTSVPLDPSVLGDVLAEVRRSLGLARLPPIGLSERIATPVVAGLFRPAVLLPASLPAAIGQGRIRDILLHECAHVARRDPWVVVLQRLVALAYWPHPCIHFLNRQLARCREEVCDNWVLRAVRPADYADTLLEVAIHCRDRFGVDMPIGLFDVHGKVEDRVRRLLDRRRDAGVRLPARARWGVMAAAAIFLAVAAAFPLVGPARAEKPRAKENQVAEEKPAVKQAAASSSEQPPSPDKSAVDKDQKYIEGTTVDSEGKLLAGVQVRRVLGTLTTTAVSGPDGHFRLPIDTNFHGTRRLLAESQDHSLIGVSDRRTPPMSRAGAQGKTNEPIRIVLKPARTVRVNVATSDGKPAAGVMIQAAVDRMFVFFDAETGRDGQAALRIPRDADVQWVVARKDDLGFDYYENFQSSPFEQPHRLPETIDLRLHKTSRVHVRTIDLGNQPVAGVLVSPQSVRLPGKMSSIPIARFPSVSQTSDANGACDFAWVPADAAEPIGFNVYPLQQGYSRDDQPQWNPAKPNIPVTFHLLKNAEISGTVRFPDGKPAAGISVLITSGGLGTIVNKTDANGHYHLPVEPRKSNIVAVSDPKWAAASHTGVRLENGQTRDRLDFVLTHGTRIHGRITLGLGGGLVTLVELGERPKQDDVASGREQGHRTLWALRDEKGNYEFRVGPGRYILRMPGSKTGEGEVEIKVTDQPELVYDDIAVWPRKMRINGRVVRAADGKAVAGAIVYGDPVGLLGSQEVRADAQGRFSTLRAADAEKWALYARAPEADLAGVAIVASSASEATIKLRPAATVVGFVYNSQGKPVAGEKVTAAFYAGSETSTGFGDHSVDAVSDQSGRYRVPCLAVGSRCVIVILGVQTSIAHIDVKPDRPGEISVRNIVFPADDAAPALTPGIGELHSDHPSAPAVVSETQKPPAADLTLTGTILDDATGKPIPDADVAVRVTRSRKEREVLEQTRHITDAAGHFTFTIRKEHVIVAGNDSNRETFVALDVTHPGYVAGTWWGYSLSKIIENMNKDKHPSFEKLRLRPGRPLTGVVAAPDGKPLADVAIEWDSYSSGPHETQSDKTGRFQVTLPAAGGVSLLIMPREYAPMLLIAEPQQADLGVLTMKKGVSLSGKVLDADGKPVVGQWVFAQTFLDRVARNSVSQLSRPLDRYTRSDAAGKVAFDPLPPGEYLVGPSEGDRWRPGAVHPITPIHGVYYYLKVKVDADGAKPFELKAQPTVKVAAQYYGSDGKKTSGPEFECVGRNPDDIGFSWQKSAIAVGGDGRYEVLVPLGMKQAGIIFRPQEKISVRFRRSADAPLQAGPELHLGTLTGDMTDIRIIRYVSPVLLIKARDRAGKPIAGAEVSVRYEDTSLYESPEFEKEKDGRFRSGSLLPDEKFTVTVTADGYRPQSRGLSLAEGTTSQLDLVLVPR